MIRENSAALIVSSATAPIEDVSARLGIEPTSLEFIGDETRNSRVVPPGSPLRFEKRSRWVFAVEHDPADKTGFGSVTRLLDALAGRESQVAALGEDFDVRIVWTGFSDSATGGFVIPAEVFPRLTLLGCDIYANADWAGA